MRQTARVIRIVCVGRARGPLAEASAEYEERLNRACKFELHEVREEGTPSLEPREAMLRERTAICLGGNHDLVVSGVLDIEQFTNEAGVAARWTRSVLTPDELEALAHLSPSVSASCT